METLESGDLAQLRKKVGGLARLAVVSVRFGGTPDLFYLNFSAVGGKVVKAVSKFDMTLNMI